MSSLYVVQPKRDQVQAFDENIQQLEFLTPIEFLKYLRVSDDLLSFKIPDSVDDFSIHRFINSANGISRSIKATC